MSEPTPPRRGRFPLPLSATSPTQRRFVTGPTESRRESPSALMSLAPATFPIQSHPPLGSLGLDSSGVRERERMVARLRADGCRDEAVLDAFARIPRHAFVDTALAAQAYEDTSLPIGHGQTISKPTVVARMLTLLRAREGGAALGRVLEIGTGCGYQAALLGLIARQVYSVERIKALHDKARDNLAPIRSDNLRLIWGDGRLGHPPNGPYDAIVSAASGLGVPPAWLDQLAPGGRLVAPVHDAARGAQVLEVIDRRADGSLVRTQLETVRFVPLESGTSETWLA